MSININNKSNIPIANYLKSSFKWILLLFVTVIFLFKSVESQSIWTVNMKARDQGFRIFWNVPTFQCHQYGLKFNDLTKSYGISQNYDDSFRGNKIAILYDPGNFPALLEQKDKSELFQRNGGVPQEGSLKIHLDMFRSQLEELIPDGGFSGIGVIDFESWRPVFRQNFGTLMPYKDLSYDIERKRHPFWPTTWIKNEASKRFEDSAVYFMKETLKVAKKVRPSAKWGYYAYPYCFNMNGNNKLPNCPNEVVDENNRIQWLWDESDILFPSVYMSKNRLSSAERLQMVKGRVLEARRVASRTNRNSLIYPYVWYKYQDETSEFVTKADLHSAISHMKNSNLNGAVIWGSSNDVSSREKCVALEQYVKNVLGPLVAEFVQLGSAKTISNSTVETEQIASEEEMEEEEDEEDQPSNGIPMAISIK
ncbi:hyaluronidase B-like [Arctopsyche grandis]|uniref:hyaluronidase B-like n=1 Tax=Arctopsyche grandis TaxID=121162 RepID=UPI00406D6D07